MDPYLEDPAVWPGVHNLLIAALCFDLAPRLRPRYYVAVEERVYISHENGAEAMGVPDVVVSRPARDDARPSGTNGQAVRPDTPGRRAAVLTVELPLPHRVRETYLEIRTPHDHQVVTVMELLSPANKRPGEGRRQYEAKRQLVLDSLTGFVEIDLLRGGAPMAVWRDGQLLSDVPGDYRILVSRGNQRPRADLFTFTVRDPIPAFRCPLQPGDDEPLVDLQRLLASTYEQGAYDVRLDYSAVPVPPLGAADAGWMADLLRGH
jgi:hypothetical protein